MHDLIQKQDVVGVQDAKFLKGHGTVYDENEEDLGVQQDVQEKQVRGGAGNVLEGDVVVPVPGPICYRSY